LDEITRLATRKTIGSRIRRRRKILGLTQSQLGDRAGVRFQQIQKYETGANEIGAVRLFEIAEALAVELQDPSAEKRDELDLAEADVIRAARAIAALPSRVRERLYTLAGAVAQEIRGG